MWLDGVARTQMEFWHEVIHPKYLLTHAYLPVAKIQPEVCGLFFKEVSSLNCTLITVNAVG